MSDRQDDAQLRARPAVLAEARLYDKVAEPPGTMTNGQIPDRYLEDFAPGMVFEFGDYLMTEEEIIAFARKYDPQPFHTERHPPPGAAHPTLIASGWHTGAATMRMLVDHFISWRCSLPSPGHDGMRFVVPVHPGDRLRVKLTVLSVRPSASNRIAASSCSICRRSIRHRRSF